MPPSNSPAPHPDPAAHDIQDRLAALRNAAYIIRLASPQPDPVVLSALRMIDQQVEHLSRWAERFDPDGPSTPG